MSDDRTVSSVVPEGDRRRSLEAIRDRLAAETDDARWTRHKRECICACGLGDGRVLVALVAELRKVIDEIDALPNGGEVTPLDELAAAVDELAPRRSRRRTNAASS